MIDTKDIDDRILNADYRDDTRWTVYVHIIPKELSGYDHDKYYVGITGRQPELRWDNGYGYSKNVHFYRAIKKYNWCNIQHEIVAQGLTKDEACEFEKALIKELKSNNQLYGYNKTIGGEGTSYEHEDLSGKTFGYLYVDRLSKETGKHGERKWDCTCLLCGNETTKYENVLKDESTVSCGCFGAEYCKTCSTTHGKSYEKIYQKFSDLKRKCYNKNCKSYKVYGEKGITVCKEWMDDFINFYNWSIENGYSDENVIFLKNGCTEFSPNNCLWVSKSEFAILSGAAKRNTKYITYNNETHSMSEWADIIGTTYTRLRDALRKKSFEEAFLYYMNKKEE